MGKSIKPVVVISGVNFIEGGPLSIFKDAVTTFVNEYSNEYSLVLLVHSDSLFSEYKMTGTKLYNYKWVKSSWLFRLWFEYVTCYFFSRRLQPLMWLALHDMTPNVVANIKAVYFHNPAPFYKTSAKEARLEPALLLFSLFYKILYRINIKANDYIIVQQQWLRERFSKDFKAKNIIVAHPLICSPHSIINSVRPAKKNFSFFYPAFPRVFKNFEVVMEATKILLQSRNDFEIIITMTGNENDYARLIYKKYNYLGNISFIGIQPRNKVLDLYQIIDCLVFPSKLETWGLPISEMKYFSKPILVANEKYAKETVGTYDKVKFFKTNNPQYLSMCMNEIITGNIEFSKTNYKEPPPPFTQNWKELFDILLT